MRRARDEMATSAVREDPKVKEKEGRAEDFDLQGSNGKKEDRGKTSEKKMRSERYAKRKEGERRTQLDCR